MENMHKSVEVVYKKLPVNNNARSSGDLHFTFFQMAYVISGNGILGINGWQMPYQKGNLMLLTPNDRHSFLIEAETEFLLIRFYTSHIKEYRSKSIDHMECLLYYASHLSGCILRNPADFPLVDGLVSSILHGLKHGGIYNEDLTIHFVNALIVIAARNIASIKPVDVGTNTDKRIIEIVDYIQTNIFYPSKLRTPVMAGRFGISNSYLGAYFKEQCGETLQHFIATYKLRLIEHRLQFSDQRINEIAHEFGFADESHLNKFFKKHKDGISLTAWRKQIENNKPDEMESERKRPASA
ncbi:AraC family transcriptional regulator [Mucilaginibacter sp. CAU 1740]|uniref:AraC family transcriptional regulator n=1 Tax=Mucilaginibacter sp. CAU 1740 TaxID=3140365 RepID=UPI00325A6047